MSARDRDSVKKNELSSKTADGCVLANDESTDLTSVKYILEELKRLTSEHQERIDAIELQAELNRLQIEHHHMLMGRMLLQKKYLRAQNIELRDSKEDVEQNVNKCFDDLSDFEIVESKEAKKQHSQCELEGGGSTTSAISRKNESLTMSRNRPSDRHRNMCTQEAEYIRPPDTASKFLRTIERARLDVDEFPLSLELESNKRAGHDAAAITTKVLEKEDQAFYDVFRSLGRTSSAVSSVRDEMRTFRIMAKTRDGATQRRTEIIKDSLESLIESLKRATRALISMTTKIGAGSGGDVFTRMFFCWQHMLVICDRLQRNVDNICQQEIDLLEYLSRLATEEWRAIEKTFDDIRSKRLSRKTNCRAPLKLTDRQSENATSSKDPS